MLLHDSKQAGREGMLGMRLAATRHPAARCPGGSAHARGEAALPVAAAAAVGAGTSISAARPIAAAAAAAARDADATQKEAAHRLNWFRRRVAAEEAAHGRSVATR